MADFKIAYDFVKAAEGVAGKNVYAVLKNDDGGETYGGIARNYTQGWSGWGIIDAAKRRYKNGRIPNNTAIPEADAAVADWYEQEIWKKKGRCDLIKSQPMANLVFDCCVQHGRAARIINRAVIEAGGKVKMVLDKKGNRVPVNEITSDTLNWLNSVPSVVYPLILKHREAYYRADDDWPSFGKGWMNRLNKFPKTIV